MGAVMVLRGGRMRLRGVSALTFAGILLAATVAEAQLNRAIMEGVVSDPQGAVIAGVDVTITDIDTNVTATTKTNSTGYYRLVDLTPGKYKLHFTAAGFSATDIRDIDVPAGQVVKMDAQLKIGSTQETVEVLAEAPLLETAASNFSQPSTTG